MNDADYAEMLKARESILAALAVEMKRRGNDTAWVAAERVAVAQAANKWAKKHHLPTRLTAADIERVEGPAVGHIDYPRKLSLYVADALYNRSPVPGTPASG